MVLLCLIGPVVLADGSVEVVPLEECSSIFSAHISGTFDAGLNNHAPPLANFLNFGRDSFFR